MKYGLALILVVVCFELQAQPSSILTYQEATKIALDKNVNLNQQENTLFSAQVQRNQSFSSFLPSVRLRANATHQDGLQQTQDGGDLENLSVDNISADIYAELLIFNGLSRSNTIGQNSNQFKAQVSFVERTRQEVIFTVTNQYLQVLLDQELLRIAGENYKTQNVVLEQLREQVAVGSRAEADLYAQQSQVSNLEVTALRATVTLENDKAILAQTLQLDPSQDYSVSLPSQMDIPLLENIALDSLYSIALVNRKDLQRLKYQAEANHYQYRSALSGYLPVVSLFGSYGSYYTSQLKDIPLYGGFSNQFQNVFPSTQYGISLTIPIFDRMQTRATRVSNKVAFDNSVLERDNLEKTIKIDVQRTYKNYKTSIRAFQASEVQIRAGELALKTQQESFLLGVADQVALAQANQTYVQAASSKAQAEVTLVFQKILLDYALGTLRFEDIP
jgi:outer membrane protein